jgi:hypothetical protein
MRAPQGLQVRLLSRAPLAMNKKKKKKLNAVVYNNLPNDISARIRMIRERKKHL